MRSLIQTPRVTGEVVVPLAVTFNTAAWVRKAPRGLSAGKETRRSRDGDEGVSRDCSWAKVLIEIIGSNPAGEPFLTVHSPRPHLPLKVLIGGK
jgi:hypothetical protein